MGRLRAASTSEGVAVVSSKRVGELIISAEGDFRLRTAANEVRMPVLFCKDAQRGTRLTVNGFTILHTDEVEKRLTEGEEG